MAESLGQGPKAFRDPLTIPWKRGRVESRPDANPAGAPPRKLRRLGSKLLKLCQRSILTETIGIDSGGLNSFLAECPGCFEACLRIPALRGLPRHKAFLWDSCGHAASHMFVSRARSWAGVLQHVFFCPRGYLVEIIEDRLKQPNQCVKLQDLLSRFL